MRWKDFAKEHRSVVVLGLPHAPIRSLFAIRRQSGCVPILFAKKQPFLLSVFPVARFHKRVTDTQGDLLAMELLALSDRYRDRYLVLLPADGESRRFTEQYGELLETNYVIRDGGLGEGDLL